ncbi:MAG: TlpA family protein disulfide reductase [Phycisphaerales bacterium]|nr:TlpA family protein disulfide reductase [Planctomycetota bacterium]MCH8507329.1 TlpA family protein disulfide reductase [Phycisphaerales bacterium]
MPRVTGCLMISCLAAMALQAPAAARDSLPAPDEPGVSEQKTGEAEINLPPGYRWGLGPIRASVETMEKTSFTLDGIGEVLVEPVVEEGMIQEVRLTFQRVEFESVSKEPIFAARFFDASGEKIFGRDSWRQTPDTVIGKQYFDKDDDVLSRAEWFGIIVLDYEGRLERARAYKNMVEAENYRVPFMPLVGGQFEFDVPTIDGDRMTHEDLLGKIVVFDAWASWCGPCIVKMPEMRRIRERFAGDGVKFVGITLEMPADDAMDKARQVIETHKLDWPHLHGFSSAETFRLWRYVAGIDGIPRLFVVDRTGVLRADLEVHQLADRLQLLLEEQPPLASAAGD